MIYPLKMVIFHSFLYVYQRVSGLCHLKRGKGWKRGVGNSSSVCKLDIWDGWTFQSWYGQNETLSRNEMACCKHGHHPLRFIGLAHGWFVSATSSCAFLLEDSNLFVSIHFDQVRLHRWRDTCPVSGWLAGIWYPEFHPGFPQLASQNLIPIIWIHLPKQSEDFEVSDKNIW